jgi:TonB family protein
MRYLYGKGLSMSQTRLRALSLVIVLIFSFLECTTSVTSPQQLDFRDLRLVRRTEPIYPPAARKRGLQGKVVLRVWVEKDGKISGMKVLNGNPIFAQAALDTVHQWRFAPDRRLPAFTTITVDFRLPSSRDLRLSNISSGDSWTTYNKTYEFQGKTYKFKARTTKESENILSPSPVFDPDPPYTPEAIKARLEGTLTLNTWIDAQGKVTRVEEVSKPLGNGLDESAITTIRTWKFAPARWQGQPVPVKITIEITFKLHKTPVKGPVAG